MQIDKTYASETCSRELLLDSNAPVREAIELLSRYQHNIVIVTSNSVVVGIVTDGDVRNALLSEIDPRSSITSIMNREFRYAMEGAERSSVEHYMLKEGVARLPELNSKGEFLGLYYLTAAARNNQNTPLLIMAGGYGMRLRPLTETVPKPMLKISGTPIIERIIVNARAQGFSKVFISVNYLAHVIEAYLRDGKSFGVEIVYLHEDSKLGTAGAVKKLDFKGYDDCVVINGDLVTSMDLTKLVLFHRANSSAATMAVRMWEDQLKYGVVEFNNNTYISSVEKPVKRYFINAGIYMLSKEVRDLVGDGYQDMPSLFDRVKINGGRAMVYPVLEPWQDIGTHEDFNRIQNANSIGN